METKRIYWDTTLDELEHTSINVAYVDLDEGELMHWKYLKREKLPNGKWRYYYDKDALKADVKAAADKVVDSSIKKANESSKWLNNIVDTAKNALGKWYNNPDNKYDVTRYNYQQKLDQIKQTKEWNDIVKSGNSEYVKKNSDGTTTFDIDKYLVDKKHPVLDIIGDIAAGREISINEITKDSLVAGLKDYASSTIEIGMLGMSLFANGLTKKFKYSQGSFDEDIATLEETVRVGSEYVQSVIDTASETSRVVTDEDWASAAADVASKVASNVNTEGMSRAGAAAVNAISDVTRDDVETLANMLKTAKTTAKNINENDVINAAKTLMESDVIKNAVGSNEYYEYAENVLTGMSEEEIMLVRMLVQAVRNDG